MQATIVGIQGKGFEFGVRAAGRWQFKLRRLARETLELLDISGVSGDEAAEVVAGFCADVRREWPAAAPMAILWLHVRHYCGHVERVRDLLMRGWRQARG